MDLVATCYCEMGDEEMLEAEPLAIEGTGGFRLTHPSCQITWQNPIEIT